MKNIVTTIILTTCMISSYSNSYAQTISSADRKEFKQEFTPQEFSNESYYVLYISNGKVYNIRGTEVDENVKYARDIAIQPGSADCAIIVKKKSGAEVKGDKVPSNIAVLKNSNKLFDAVIKDKKKSEILTLHYTPNGKRLIVGFADKSVRFFETKEYEPQGSFSTGVKPQIITTSENDYFAAVSDGSKVEVWNILDMNIRTTLSFNADVTSIAFSADNSMMAVLTDDGTATIYDTRAFAVKDTLTGLGKGQWCMFHRDNKYIAVVTDENTILFVNLKDHEDTVAMKSEGGVKKFRYCFDYSKPDVEYLIYTNGNNLVWHQITGLKENLGQILLEGVNSKMNEWMKKRDDESMDEYRIRVNDETRATQQLAFEHELATSLAGDMINSQNAKLGSYNAGSELLQVSFDALPSITLGVPKEEITAFSKVKELEFTNTVYALNEKDGFEVIYTEVLNKETGSKYVYDNLDRKSVTSMAMDEGFVPLELIQQSNMEEMILKDIRERVMAEAKLENKITDHTHINVNTEILNDVDANGKNILNYKVNYNYEVEEEFIAQDDFAAGRYKAEESNAAMSMLKIVQEAFSNEFAQYIKAGKRIKVKVSGSADAAPIRGNIAYDGSYGDFENELCYKNGQLSKISVTKASGITENEQLAFLRASGVKDYIEKNIPALSDMNCEYQYNIELSDKKGAEYRRIGVEFLFIDTFQK